MDTRNTRDLDVIPAPTACEARPVKNYTWQHSGASWLPVCGHSAVLHHGSHIKFSVNRSISAAATLSTTRHLTLTKSPRSTVPNFVPPSVSVSPNFSTNRAKHSPKSVEFEVGVSCTLTGYTFTLSLETWTKHRLTLLEKLTLVRAKICHNR